MDGIREGILTVLVLTVLCFLIFLHVWLKGSLSLSNSGNRVITRELNERHSQKGVLTFIGSIEESSLFGEHL